MTDRVYQPARVLPARRLVLGVWLAAVLIANPLVLAREQGSSHQSAGRSTASQSAQRSIQSRSSDYSRGSSHVTRSPMSTSSRVESRQVSPSRSITRSPSGSYTRSSSRVSTSPAEVSRSPASAPRTRLSSPSTRASEPSSSATVRRTLTAPPSERGDLAQRREPTVTREPSERAQRLRKPGFPVDQGARREKRRVYGKEYGRDHGAGPSPGHWTATIERARCQKRACQKRADPATRNRHEPRTGRRRREHHAATRERRFRRASEFLRDPQADR